jgi:hypothetical protein
MLAIPNPMNSAFGWGSMFYLLGALRGAGLVWRGPCANLAQNILR